MCVIPDASGTVAIGRQVMIDVAALLSGVVGIAGGIPRPVKALKRLKDQS
jgi:hypothetical protein